MYIRTTAIKPHKIFSIVSRVLQSSQVKIHGNKNQKKICKVTRQIETCSMQTLKKIQIRCCFSDFPPAKCWKLFFYVWFEVWRIDLWISVCFQTWIIVLRGKGDDVKQLHNTSAWFQKLIKPSSSYTQPFS